jgi:hypothetical protein
VYWGGAGGAPSTPVRVSVDANASDGFTSAITVTTEAGTYVVQKQAGSISQLLDADGADWVSWHDEATPSALGFYRGIPNFKFPTGNFHPGFSVATASVVAQGPLRVKLRMTSSANGSWAYTLTFFPRFVRGDVTSASAPYWILYEGTPGGEAAGGFTKPYTVRYGNDTGTGTPLGATDPFTLPAASATWATWTAGSRSFFMAQAGSNGTTNSYYGGGTGGAPGSPVAMAVFGFGRNEAGTCSDPDTSNRACLTGPHTWTMGLLSPSSIDDLVAAVNAARKPLTASVGATEGNVNPPGPPTSISAMPQGTGAVRLSWGPASLAIDYAVTIDPPGTTQFVYGQLADFPNLVPGQSYTFTVRGRNPGGLGTPATFVYAVPLPPDPPTAVVATLQGPHEVSVSWNRPASLAPGTPASYLVTPSGGTTVGTTTTGATLTGLTEGTTYTFSVRTNTSAGLSAPAVSNPVTIPVPAPVVLPPAVSPDYVPAAFPARSDSREPGPFGGRFAAGEVRRVGGSPGAAAVLNVTATSSAAPGYLTLWPCDAPGRRRRT